MARAAAYLSSRTGSVQCQSWPSTPSTDLTAHILHHRLRHTNHDYRYIHQTKGPSRHSFCTCHGLLCLQRRRSSAIGRPNRNGYFQCHFQQSRRRHSPASTRNPRLIRQRLTLTSYVSTWTKKSGSTYPNVIAVSSLQAALVPTERTK